VATQAAARPHGEITTTFSADAPGRQAAYKLLEHGHLPHTELVRAAASAAWARADTRTVIVSVDPCFLSLPAATRAKGFGPVGDRKSTTLGAIAINAVLLSPRGVPLGLAGQCFWRRAFRFRKKKPSNRPIEQKETRFWLEVGEQVRQGARAAAQQHQRTYLPWLQFDAGADAREVLEWAAWTTDVQVTVRNQNERNTLWPEEAKLRAVLGAEPVLGRYRVRVPRGEGQVARKAVLAVRCREVVLPLKDPWTKTVRPVSLFAVQAKEEGCPVGGEPLEWVLLTTRPVRGFRGAREVLRAYTLRWRVEEVHRAWKKGGCQVERSGLRYEAFQGWALLLICVAVRAERLKRMSREKPEAPATSEFTEQELRALVLLRKKKGEPVEGLTLWQAVVWVAELGGYVGKSSGGPPGATTIRRGLDRLEPAAELLRALDAQK
jgi:hypothetical protein